MSENEHMGHRKRMRERYDKTGLDGFADHEIVEMLLYYSIRQGNTNGTAHELLKRFDSIKNIIHTPPERLMQIKGVGKESARMLSMLGELYDKIERSKEPQKLDSSTAQKFFTQLFKGKTKEEFYIICLDPQSRILSCKKLSEGSFETVEINIGEAVKVALDFNSAQVVFAHNHPSGIDVASDADIAVTRSLESALYTFGIKVRDHIIVADNRCVSIMANYKIRRGKGFGK